MRESSRSTWSSISLVVHSGENGELVPRRRVRVACRTTSEESYFHHIHRSDLLHRSCRPPGSGATATHDSCQGKPSSVANEHSQPLIGLTHNGVRNRDSLGYRQPY